MFPFERLEVWHDAMAFTNSVYDALETLPTEERYELASQLRRSSNSVAANLAEGASRRSDRERLRYIEQAYGSLMETVSHLRLARMRQYLSNEASAALYQEAEILGRRMSGLRDSIERRRNTKQT